LVNGEGGRVAEIGSKRSQKKGNKPGLANQKVKKRMGIWVSRRQKRIRFHEEKIREERQKEKKSGRRSSLKSSKQKEQDTPEHG